ncbi:MAG TPA: hypothetical protein VH186_19035 [Chloroflexia bacterium]|nr:hypothetical protein [Chloroflexia bacterium]
MAESKTQEQAVNRTKLLAEVRRLVMEEMRKAQAEKNWEKLARYAEAARMIG